MQRETTYAKAIPLKFPEQVVIAIAKDPQGKYNPITLGWTMVVSHVPPMMAVSIGLTRYSMEAFQKSCGGEFVIAFPSEHQAEETLFYGTKSGRDMDKLVVAGANTQPACKIDCVILADAVANFECKLAGQLQTGDHVVFAGEIVCSHVNTSKKPLRRLYTIGEGYQFGGLDRL